MNNLFKSDSISFSAKLFLRGNNCGNWVFLKSKVATFTLSPKKAELELPATARADSAYADPSNKITEPPIEAKLELTEDLDSKRAAAKLCAKTFDDAVDLPANVDVDVACTNKRTPECISAELVLDDIKELSAVDEPINVIPESLLEVRSASAIELPTRLTLAEHAISVSADAIDVPPNDTVALLEATMAESAVDSPANDAAAPASTERSEASIQDDAAVA